MRTKKNFFSKINKYIILKKQPFFQNTKRQDPFSLFQQQKQHHNSSGNIKKNKKLEKER